MRHRVCENSKINGFAKTFYVGDDPRKAWDVYRKQSALDTYFGGGHGISLMQWDDRGIGSWHTVVTSSKPN